jgi:regulator of protease activity HflC (stomatin/prohibitin superfamily)
MTIGIILGIVFGLLFLAGFIAGGIALYYGVEESETKYKVGGWIGLATGIVTFFLFIFIPFSFHTIESGEIAVVKEMGKIVDTREAGTHFDFWVVRSYEKYDTKVRGVNVTTAAYSHDKQPMDIQMTIQYQVNQDKVKDIASTYGSLDALESRIQSVAIERTKSRLSNYDADSIIETRGTISAEVATAVEDAIGEQYFVDITNVSLTNIDFSDAYEQSVEQSMIAKQEVEKAKAEAEKAIAAAKGELEVTKLQAQAKLESAKADADAQKLIAEAEAAAVKLKSIEMARALGFEIIETEVQGDLIIDDEGNAVLDENGNEQYETMIEYTINFEGATESEIQLLADYMQYIEYLSKWDGKLPTVMSGDSATIMIPTTP